MLRRENLLDLGLGLLFAVGACLLFWPALVQGRLIFGFDTLAFGVPNELATRACLRAGEWPLWQPGIDGGMPGLAACNLAFAYPSDLLGFLARLDLAHRIGVDAALHVWIAAMGMYVLLRRSGLSRPSSALGAAFFALSGAECSNLKGGYLNFMEGVAWTPWVFASAQAALSREGGAWEWACFGATLGMQVLAGASQLALLAAAAAVPMALVGDRGLRPAGFVALARGALPWGALAAAFAVAVSAPQLFPTLRYLPQCARQGYLLQALRAGSLEPKEWLVWIAPGFLGWPGLRYHGTLNLRFTTDYLGLLPWALAAAALTAPARAGGRRYAWVGLGLAAAFLSQRAWAPFLPWFQRLPLLSGMRDWSRALFLADFAACVLAAEGWEALHSGPAPDRARAGALVFWLVAALGLAWSWRLAVGSAVGSAPRMPWVATDPSRAAALLVSSAWVSLRVQTALVAAGALLTLMAGRRRNAAGLVAALTLAACFHCADWGLNLARFNRATPPGSRIPAIPFVGPAPAPPRTSPWRVFDVYDRYPNRAMLQGYENLAGSASMPMAAYLRLQAALETAPGGWTRWLDVMGVRYVFRHPPPDSPAPDRVTVQPNLGAYPRAWLVSQDRGVPDEVAALHVTADPAFDPRHEAVFLRPPSLAGGLPQGRVTWVHWDSQRFRLEVTTDRRCALVISNFWYPQWKARVDGAAAPVLRADGAIQAVVLAPGTHSVAFRYDPTLFEAGLGAFLAAAAILAVWAAARRAHG